jgi:hypothetical protein
MAKRTSRSRSHARTDTRPGSRPGSQPARPFLAASLIVRDEADNIGACLAALAGVVDEIHVHDTGSTDNTPDLARLAGATVTRGTWTGDFAAARNEALAGWTADWVLTVDADEIVVADRGTLRRFLTRTTADVIDVAIDNVTEDGVHRHGAARIHRPAAAQWQGRVHERIVGSRGPARSQVAGPETVRIDHTGYSTEAVRRAKGLRNAEIARTALADLAHDGNADPGVVAQTMLDLGRCLYSAQDLQGAIDAFEAARELFPGTPVWTQATDSFARLALDNGLPDVSLTLILQLRGAGVDAHYCDWLESRCLAGLGHFAAARELLAPVTEVTSLGGLRVDPAHLAAFREQLEVLAAASAP